MLKKKLFILLLPAVLFQALLLSNPVTWKPLSLYKHRIYTSQDGLPQNSVFDIAQTPDGFIWMATDIGLARFDGIKFDVFDGESSEALSMNLFHSLLVDHKGVLWIGSWHGGIVCYKDGRFKKMFSRGNGLSSNKVLCMYQDRSHTIWVGTRLGLDRISNGRVSRVSLSRTDAPQKVEAVVEDSRRRIWIAADNGIYLLDAERPLLLKNGNGQARANKKKVTVRASGLKGESFCSLAVDRQGRVWAGSNGKGVVRLSVNQNSILAQPLANRATSKFVSSLFVDNDGSLRMGSRNIGLARIKEENVMLYSERNGLSHNYVTALFRDREQNLWVATNGGGINLFSDSTITMLHSKNVLSHDNVLGLFQDRDDNMWIGTFATGVDRVKAGKVNKNITTWQELPLNLVLSTTQGPDGDMWFGTYGAGITRKQNNKFISYGLQHGLTNLFIYSLYFDRQGRLWAGTMNGAIHGFKNGRFHLKKQFRGKIRAVLQDREGDLWFASDEAGVIRLKGGDTNDVEVFDESGGLSSPDVLAIFEDSKGSIWVATFGGGVNRLNRKNGRFQAIGSKQGLGDDIIYWILEDDSNRFWMSSMKGIFRVNRRTLEDFFKGKLSSVTSVMYNESDGMLVKECNGGAHAAGWRSRDGRLWFVTARGVAVIDPNHVMSRVPPPPAIITAVKVDGLSHQHLPELKLSPGKRNFEIHYTAPSFVAPDHIWFEYKLEGYDNRWRKPDKRRTAYYTNISYGKYRFRVRAGSRDGNWNKKEAVFNISVAPWFWQTLWFRLLAILFILAVIRWFFYNVNKNAKRQKLKLKSLVKERTGSLEVQTEELEKKTLELEGHKADLERIHLISTSINVEMAPRDVLMSILKETAVLKGVGRALALVYDKRLNAYRFAAAFGLELSLMEHIRLTYQEAEERYIKDARQISPDIFIVKDVKGRAGEEKFLHVGIPRSMLIMKIRGEQNTTAGYLIFVDMKSQSALETQDMHVLTQLKGHITSAFIKSKLLLELEAERAAAEEANRAKSMFLARMSHEIRTPMNSVIGFADILLNTQLDRQQREFAGNITRSGEALLHLIDEILDFSKIEAGRLEIETTDFDLRVTLSDVCKSMYPRIENKSVQLVCHIDDNVPHMVKSDEARIRQVLVNLVGNAVKFTLEGEVALSLSVADERPGGLKLHFTVRDTGIGISQDQQNSIFEVFQQADGSNTRKYGGTGLGLAISKQIAALLMGDIRVESYPDMGSTFHFTAWVEPSYKKRELKEIAPAVEKNLREPEPQPDIQKNVRDAHILLVEDNSLNRKLARYMITKGGYTMDIALTGKQAVDIYTAEPEKFNLILMDINMPEMDGREATRIIRQRGFTKVPIIAMTAHALQEDRKSCFEAGMNDYISKPIKRSIVFAMIEKWTVDS